MKPLLLFFLVSMPGVSALAQTGVAGTSTPAPPLPPDRIVAGKSLQQMMLDDQSELPTRRTAISPPITYEEYVALGQQRRARVLELTQQGELKTGEDFYLASTLFQHGETADDYLLAHIFAMDAVLHGYDRAKWIAAATLDRYLQLVHQPQVFGTQYPLADPGNAPAPAARANMFSGRTQLPFNADLVPPALRRDFCVADLEQQKRNLETMNGGKYPPGAEMVAPGCIR